MSIRSSPPKALLSSFESLDIETNPSSPNLSPRLSPRSSPRLSPRSTPRSRSSPTKIRFLDELDQPSRPTRLKLVGLLFIFIATLLIAKHNHHILINTNKLAKSPTYSILPKKIISVIGLESSGTQFVSKIFEDALNTGPYREGSLPCNETCADESRECQQKKKLAKPHACVENSDVQIQHFSLPWGADCISRPNPPVVDVILPQQCSRVQSDPNEIQQCNEMAADLWGLQLNGKAMEYPKRYQLDITTHKKWYDARGVEQIFVIVMRDSTISYTARKSHCRDPDRREEEEKVGMEIIIDAINTFILKDNNEKLTTKSFTHWVAKQDKDNRKRRLSALPSRDNVVLVSYESLIKLGGTYVKMLYATLGIDSDFIPDIKDSNEKYLNNTRDRS
ncbi:hypothetical protein ACHAW5_010320 [Stephanodiscus triporus]|uniref:Sulfotransferase n=1 Tax=Stephanodiscus triporus TaxID=2934178 RepID=A0ABD3Q5I1_9STRA